MSRNKLVLWGVLCSVVVAACVLAFFAINKSEQNIMQEPAQKQEIQQPQPVDLQEEKMQPVKQETVKVNTVKKADLNGETNLPFSGIVTLISLPDKIQSTVNKITGNNGIYLLEKKDGKLLVVYDTSSSNEDVSWRRHDFNIAEISLSDGKVINTGYQKEVIDNNSEHDLWEYSGKNDFSMPLKHVHYDYEKRPEYTEIWNYEHEEPVRYKLTDGDGRTISMMKEIITNDTNLRQEHLFYDKQGTMIMNVSMNYDGNDMTRFTYYDALNPENGATVINEYSDGLKTKETVYSPDFKVKNIYTAIYKDDLKTEIKVYDGENKEVDRVLAK